MAHKIRCIMGSNGRSAACRRLLASVALALAMMGFAMGPLRAQVIEPSFPFPPQPPATPAIPQLVTVELHAVDAEVDGSVASVDVTQVLRNDSGQTAEGVYLFPLPKDAAISDFQMTVDGETLEGKLLTREEARRIYEQIVREQRDPALLEYIDRGVFQANVFPIPAGESRTLEFRYTHVLDQENGLRRFVYPLRTRQYSALEPERVTLTVMLRNQPGLRTIYSPELPIRVEHLQEDSALISYSASGEQPPADLALYFGTDESEIGLNLLSYKPAGEDGYFALLAAPSVEVAREDVAARDILLVVDISGSMKGEKMEQARGAARFVVEALNPDDQFDVIAFSSASEAWAGGLQPVNAENRAEALQWIDDLSANGSTDINRALLEALAELDEAGEGDRRPAYILFLTDGQPTVGEVDPDRIVDNTENNAPDGRSVRLFPFGIGYDVNTELLDTLGRMMGGRSAYVRPDERIDEAVSSFYAQMSTPVLTDIALDLGDSPGVEQVFPFPLPDLFAGEQLVVVGRYSDGGDVSIELRGEVNGEERLYVYPDRSLVERGGEPFVARLWAVRRIGVLQDEVRRNGAQQELIDEIIDLSLRYGIVTPYTSYLVVEPGQPAGGPTDATARDGGGAAMPTARSIIGDAEKGVAVAAAEAAAAAPSGAAAVEASIASNNLQAATRVVQEDAVRYAGGHAFQRQWQVIDAAGRAVDLWVDTAYRAEMDVTVVEFGSDEYFALLDEPGMAERLALGVEMLVVTGEETAVRVTAERVTAAE